jgi:EAL domain-containing protein (putative c-di-GMP-specific phosphodiesterase class I)
VDTVKIDRSFVTEAVTSVHHRVLIEATVRVAKSLHMGTVAEGIETVGQCAVVRSLGCEKGQGYLFSKPMLAVELAQWVAGVGDANPALPSAGTVHCAESVQRCGRSAAPGPSA